jgi:hypothetical protein
VAPGLEFSLDPFAAFVDPFWSQLEEKFSFSRETFMEILSKVLLFPIFSSGPLSGLVKG